MVEAICNTSRTVGWNITVSAKGVVSMIYLCIIRKLKMLELSCLFYGCQISAWQHIYGKCLIVSNFVASLHPYTRWDLVTLTDFCHSLQFPLVGQEKAFKIQNMWWVEMVLLLTLLLFPPSPCWFVAQRLNVSSWINSQITDFLSFPDKSCNYCLKHMKKMCFCI